MKRSYILIYIVLIVFFAATGGCQAQQVDTNTEQKIETEKYPPKFLFEPAKLELAYPDSGKFVTGRVKVLNPGDSTLKIYHITASCFCGFSVVLDRSIEPGEEGEIEFSINLEGLEGSNWVSFIVKSNAENSPVEVPVYVIKKDVPKPEKACETKKK